MYQHRLTRLAALALVAGAVAAPMASAQEQDLRSPDNQLPAPAGDRQSLRSPDAIDAAEGRGTSLAPDVVVVRPKEPQGQPVADGIDWGDAGIGAGALAGLTLVGLGGTLLVVHRRHGRKASHA